MSRRIIWVTLCLAGCGDAEPPPSEAAVSVMVEQSQSPAAADLAGCPRDREQLTFPQQTETLDSETPETANIETLKNGVSCQVTGSGDRYEVDLAIDANEYGGVGVFELSTILESGTSTTPANLYWLYQGTGLRGECTVSADLRADGQSLLEPGRAKLTFACDPVESPDAQACGLSGTIYIANCGSSQQ